jgi:hypothetical protein
MGHVSLRQLDGELKSSLLFEFVPIYEGGIFSGEIPAIPQEEGAIFLETTTNDPSSVYVRFKGNPFMDFCANLYVYFGFTQSGVSTLPINFEIHHQRVFLQATPDLQGPIPFSLIPAGNSEYQSTYELISLTYPLKVETVTRNSLVRFELVRVADTNPDDITLLDMNFLIIPSYVDLSHFTLYPSGPSCSIVIPGVLSNKGELLSHNGTQDVAIAPPGASPRVLTHTGVGPTCIEWVDPSVFTGTNKLYAGTSIIAAKTLVAAETDFIYKIENTSASSFDIDLPLASTLANGNFFSFQIESTSVDPVDIKPQGPDALFDLTGGSVASITLNTIGQTAEIITDGTNWFVYNIYEEAPGIVSAPGITVFPHGAVATGDFVYIAPSGLVEKASASTLATMPVVGVIIGPLGGPGPGLVDVLTIGVGPASNVAPIALEVPGTQYIMSTTPGLAVAVDDIGNAAYPSLAGEIVQTVAVLSATGIPNTFYVNPDITTLEL